MTRWYASSPVSPGLPADGGRRRLMALAAALAASGWAGPALARTQAQELMAQFTGGQAAASAPLRIELPEMADNANAVPLGIRIDEAVTENMYCKELIVVAEKNPRPLICRFRFTSLLETVDIATRIRLSETQSVTVLAKMSDGRILQQRQAVMVVAGGCGG